MNERRNSIDDFVEKRFQEVLKEFSHIEQSEDLLYAVYEFLKNKLKVKFKTVTPEFTRKFSILESGFIAFINYSDDLASLSEIERFIHGTGSQ